MELPGIKKDRIAALQKEILSMQGFREMSERRIRTGMPYLDAAFPGQVFPAGVIHELGSSSRTGSAATAGFMACLLGLLSARSGGLCLWISARRTLFPPALAFFNIPADRIIFIDVAKESDVIWAVEEALKCNVLTAVVGELEEISFTQSRRLQLAVEHSHVTGLMHCFNVNKITQNTCVARWKIDPVPSLVEEDMPGIGQPAWQVALLKIRNGKPGRWNITWSGGRLRHLVAQPAASMLLQKTA